MILMSYSRNKPTPKPLLIVTAIFGFIAFLSGFEVIVVAFKMIFNPSPTNTLVVSGVSEHPGDPSFKSAAEALFLLGVIMIVVGLIVAIITTYKFFSHNHTKQPRRIQITNPQNDDYSNANNLLGESLPSSEDMNELSSENTITGYSEPSDSFVESFSSSSQSSVSNTNCSFCGAMIKPNEKFCNNCGKRL